MKAVLTLAIVSALVGAKYYFGGGCCGMSCPEADCAPSGTFVEARTASVFAGACHYTSELVTAGREALLAWSFDGGRIDGASLANVDVVAAIAGADNLAQSGARRSVIYVDRDADERARAAAVEYVRANCAHMLGTVIAIESTDVDARIDADHYAVHVGNVIELEGSGMPDRACCSMPFNVWYQPAVALEGKLVGNSARFEWREARLAQPFERLDQNDAFFGSFGGAKACAGAAPCEASDAMNRDVSSRP